MRIFITTIFLIGLLLMFYFWLPSWKTIPGCVCYTIYMSILIGLESYWLIKELRESPLPQGKKH